MIQNGILVVLQIPQACIRIRKDAWKSVHKTSDKGELLVKEIIDRCSMSESKVDLSFLYQNPMMLVCLIEFKKGLESPAELDSAVKQTVCNMLGPLAFSRWGIWKRRKPLVALIVCFDSLFRLTLSRPAEEPFGFKLKVEKTKNVKMIEWVLHTYVMSYAQDFHTLSTSKLKRGKVSPLSWIPINMDFGGFKWEPIARPNLGFLFKTSREAVFDLLNRYNTSFPLPRREMPLIVKYLSSLLYIPYLSCRNPIQKMLDAASKKGESARRKEAERKLIALQAFLAVEPILPQKAEGSGSMDSESDPSMGPELDPTPDSTPPVIRVDQAQSNSHSNILGIRHPYLGVLYLDNYELHPLLVMRDVGTSLTDLLMLRGSSIRTQWQRSEDMRAAFFSQVGLSAINLVQQTDLCHNDIRPPNIAVQDGSFCLIDFDLASENIMCHQRQTAFSPYLKAEWNWVPRQRKLCFSIAQVAVCVFMLSSLHGMDEVAAACSIWNEKRDPASRVDVEFEDWAKSCGEPFLGFVKSVRRACCAMPQRSVSLFPRDIAPHLVRVLRCMLQLPLTAKQPLLGIDPAATASLSCGAPPASAAADRPPAAHGRTVVSTGSGPVHQPGPGKSEVAMGLLHGRGSSGRKRGRQAVADRQPACGGREAVVHAAAAGGDVVSQGASAGEHAGTTARRGGREGRQSAAQK